MPSQANRNERQSHDSRVADSGEPAGRQSRTREAPPGNIFAIGEPERLRGLALAGVRVAAVRDPEEVGAAWRALPEDVGLVILTAAARAALTLTEREERLWVVMPE